MHGIKEPFQLMFIFLIVRYWAKACAVLTCLLGTTWLLGLFFLGKASVVMAYLFNIFNVLQVNTPKLNVTVLQGVMGKLPLRVKISKI